MLSLKHLNFLGILSRRNFLQNYQDVIAWRDECSSW